MRKIALIVSILTILTSLSGCAKGQGEDIQKIPPLTLDEVAGRRLLATTNEEREAEMYKYVSDRIVVDKSRLIEVDSKDRENITKLFSNINTQLTGKNTNALSEEYANYLLLEFAKTPYEWKQTNMDIVGFDPASRLYFVDVTYSTTGVQKQVVPNSKIPTGHPDEEALKQKRYTDYITMLTLKNNMDDRWVESRNIFEQRWGTISSIMEEQQGVSLYARTMAKGQESGGIGKLTYSGLVSDNKLAKPATMSIRYVLQYRLNLGEETDLMVNSLYLKNYEVKDYESILNSYDTSTVGTIEVLKPFIDQLILSYHKAVEESNFIGLYSLFTNFGNIDKYYEELRDYTYNSIGGYTYRVLERRGTNVVVQVNRVNQIRARGANMSLPTYDETVIFNLVLGNDDKIRINSVHPVKIELIGEPLSVIKNVSGISEVIQYSDSTFTETNKLKVEQLIRDFSKVVTNANINSYEFLKTVDLGVSQSTLNRMVDTITSIKANRKALYIVNWNTRTNVYVSVTVREVFELDNNNLDTEAVIDMVNRNGEWKVVNYTRTMNIRTNKSILNTNTAFTVDERTSEGETTNIPEQNNQDIVTPETVDEEQSTENLLNKPLIENETEGENTELDSEYTDSDFESLDDEEEGNGVNSEEISP